jgi:subtilisin family serine protease
MFTLKRLVTAAALMLLLTAAAHGVVEGVEGEDYATGALIVKFDRPVKIGEEDGVITTGIPEIDAINVEIGAYNYKQIFRLPDEPRDDERDKWTWEDLLNAYEKRGLGNVYLVEFDDGKATVSYAVGEYEDAEAVEFAEPNGFGWPCVTDPNDLYYQTGFQWYLNGTEEGSLDINLGWDYETGNAGFKIAIIDTGVSFVHPDLKGWTKIVSPWDVVNDNDRPLDAFAKWDGSQYYSYGHGTQVAGIAAAITNNAGGDFHGGIAGVDWHARIMPIKVYHRYWDVFSGGYKWTVSEEHLAEGIWYAAINGADVINMSLAYTHWWNAVYNACDSAYNDFGCLLVASAGNDGPGNVRKPASYASVIAVSAIDKNAVITPWSSTGDAIE